MSGNIFRQHVKECVRTPHGGAAIKRGAVSATAVIVGGADATLDQDVASRYMGGYN